MYIMAQASNLQIETTVQMDVTASGENMEVPYMDDGPSLENSSSSGELAVEWWNLLFTFVGFIFYMFDLGSDIGTSVYYTSNGQWWQAVVTLAIVYFAVFNHTGWKWQANHIHCTGAADWLRYAASLLVNWPDVKYYGALCRLEWNMFKSPAENAHLILEWRGRRANVAFLKYIEGVYEACPQAVLQLCLLLPDLYGFWTWTDYFRIAGACVSLCTAGATLVNWEKFYRIDNNTDLPLSELVVLHVWVVPVVVSHLLSLALLLSVHPYWILAVVALQLVLCGVYLCRCERVPRALDVVFTICASPFIVTDSVTARRVLHAVHCLLNTAMMLPWAVGTPLVCAHPALYTAIICFNAVMMAVALVGMELHKKYWRRDYYNIETN